MASYIHCSDLVIPGLLICSARRSKTNISLVPRVLAKKSSEGIKKETAETENKGTKLSNEDFRKLMERK